MTRVHRARTFMYVVGTRPNFMKTAPVLEAMGTRAPSDQHVLVHTGQHYDPDMSQVFFEELSLPRPDHHLGVGSGRPGAQLAEIIDGVERLIVDLRPDVVRVPGDVNSTLAAALAPPNRTCPSPTSRRGCGASTEQCLRS